MTRVSLAGLLILCAIVLLSRPLHAQTGSPTIEDGSKVTLQMTITLPNDHVMIPPHTSEYTHGAKQLLPGLEQALVGLHSGDTKRVELDADHAFGQYDAGKKMTVPRAQLPHTIARGDMATTAEGRPFTVVSLSDESAVVDFNHPLAGKHIVLDIVVLNVKPKA
ncbi:MAG TPA: FKBP-type peptidyl-prolyl cis-trans isomerase [Nitrospira sp.]|nr:FKBP-type peptidyl-prolyl cis-trans isomerase [Nitrospira sp.]HNP39872.1 FKBP-type peptidyl-prolyl cis-trans isomerase [Nitrospira sp.]